MSELSSNIKDRVLQLAEIQEGNKQIFFAKTGLKYGNFTSKSKKSDLASQSVADILSTYPDVNPTWLLTGKGSMLNDKYVQADKELETYEAKLLAEQKKAPKFKGIPLVLTAAIAGFGGSAFTLDQKDVKDYYQIPAFRHKQVDFMMEIDGSSMYPKYNSGDVVACTILKERRFLQWNKVHVVATKEQGIIVKRIHEGSAGTLKMVSDNERYPPFEVPEDEITGIALVVGVIRLE